jgi:hypothetical protein
MEVFNVLAYVFALGDCSVFGSFLVVCIAFEVDNTGFYLLKSIENTRTLRSGRRRGLVVGALVFNCSYTCWNVVAIFSNVAHSIVISLTFVLQEASYISCSCLRAWNISCSGSMGAFVDGVSVIVVVVVSW